MLYEKEEEVTGFEVIWGANSLYVASEKVCSGKRSSDIVKSVWVAFVLQEDNIQSMTEYKQQKKVHVQTLTAL